MSYQVLQNNEDSTTAATIDAAVTNSWVWAWMERCAKINPKDKLKEETSYDKEVVIYLKGSVRKVICLYAYNKHYQFVCGGSENFSSVVLAMIIVFSFSIRSINLA